MTHTTEDLPRDNKFKHCREWVETTLLTQIDGKTLAMAGLLAGEILLISAIGLWGMIALIMLKGSLAQRLTITLRALAPWLPFIVICTLLSLVGAQLAQWGERRYRRGRLTAAAALVPIMPLILAVFLKPSLFMIAPILGIGSIWLLGWVWWQLFSRFLRYLATFDYWAQLEQESKPPSSDWLYEHRHYLETKKTALMERKLRWGNMAGNSPEPSDPATDKPRDSWSTGPSLASPWMRRWAFPLIIACLLSGSAIWHYKSRVSHPKVAATPLPASLVFWYQASEPEASLLKDLVLAYNVMTDQEEGVPAVQGCNQVDDLSLQIYRAQITGETPDVMLVSEELAGRLRTGWESDGKTPDGDSMDSPDSTELRSELFTPLWPDRLWRQRLVLVISPTTKLQREAETFTTYLHSQLSTY